MLGHGVTGSLGLGRALVIGVFLCHNMFGAGSLLHYMDDPLTGPQPAPLIFCCSCLGYVICMKVPLESFCAGDQGWNRLKPEPKFLPFFQSKQTGDENRFLGLMGVQQPGESWQSLPGIFMSMGALLLGNMLQENGLPGLSTYPYLYLTVVERVQFTKGCKRHSRYFQIRFQRCHQTEILHRNEQPIAIYEMW